MNVSRRDLMKMSLLAGTAVALPFERSVSGLSALSSRIATSALPAPFTTPFHIPQVILPDPELSTGGTDFFRVSMQPTSAEIIPGLRTDLWGYNGQVPGPTFKITQGRPAVVRQINNLPATHP